MVGALTFYLKPINSPLISMTFKPNASNYPCGNAGGCIESVTVRDLVGVGNGAILLTRGSSLLTIGLIESRRLDGKETANINSIYADDKHRGEGVVKVDS